MGWSFPPGTSSRIREAALSRPPRMVHPSKAARIARSSATVFEIGAMLSASTASSWSTRYPRASVSVLGAHRLVINTRRRISSASSRRVFSGPAPGNSAWSLLRSMPTLIGASAAVRAACTGAVRASDASTARVSSPWSSD